MSLLAPAGLVITVFLVVPSIAVIAMSFFRIDLKRAAPYTFNGLDNFRSILADPLFLEAVPRTLYFSALLVAGVTLVGLFVALLLNERFRGRGLLRVVVLIPWAVAPAAAGAAWNMVFHPVYGGLNAVAYVLGLITDYEEWLADPAAAIHLSIVAQIWIATPFASLIILARLQSIPSSIYRAALIDGAGRWQRFWFMTMPLLRPTLLIVVILELTFALQAFDLVYAMTHGGPARQTLLIGQVIYETAFSGLRLGYSAAIAVLLALIIVATSSGVFAISRAERRRTVAFRP
jgi:multiple sugar transport system permease protein